MKELIVKSSFKDNEFMDKKFTCEGQDVNPELVIEGIPENAKSIAIICDDPDAPIGTFNHWLLWNYPVNGSITVIAEGLQKVEKLANGTIQGKNSFGKVGYNGPCPPKGHGVHHYYFDVYALDAMLNLPSSTSKNELLKEIEKHTVAKGRITGLYQRK